MGEFMYAALCLSIPFIFGVIVGRGLRPDPVRVPCGYTEREHILGRHLSAHIEDVHFRMKCVGTSERTGYQFEDSRSVTISGRPKVEVIVRAETTEEVEP